MATNKITYTLDFKANFKDVQGQLNKLHQSLAAVTTKRIGTGDISADIREASSAAMQLEGHLKKALDPRTGRLDLTKFQAQLKASGTNATKLSQSLLKGGKEGATAFLQLGNAISNAQSSMFRLNEMGSKLWGTLKNTARWQISSSVLNAFTRAFSNSLQYVKDLDKSLNHIRVVSGETRANMEDFAKKANQTAKILRTTTKAVADANLIYRQQGDSAEVAQKKAEITIKAANVAGTAAKEMSEYLTAIWNSYQVGANNLELFVDKLVKVGATTATSAEELATSMEKVASTANAVGVNYDQLLSTIATVSSATRLSSEQIGTAFKTIYARMGDLELKGFVDEEGVTTTLGTISTQLAQVGVNVLDTNGNLKDMGSIVENLGDKWQNFSANQKTAVAEAVAGKRQYTQLFALFENWDKYKNTVNEAAAAQSSLNEQQEIYADSLAGAKARLTAAKEGAITEFVDSEALQDAIDLTADMVTGLTEIGKILGGIVPLASMLFGSILMKNSSKISQGIVDIGSSLFSSFSKGNKVLEKFHQEWNKITADAMKMPAFQNSEINMNQLEMIRQRNEIQLKLAQNQKKMTESEKNEVKILMDQVEAERLRNDARLQSNLDKRQSATSNIYDKSGISQATQTKIQDTMFDLNKMGASSEVLQGVNHAMELLGKTVNTNNISIKQLGKAFGDLTDKGQNSIVSILQQHSAFKGLQGAEEDVRNAISALLYAYSEEYDAEQRIIENNNRSIDSMKNIVSEMEKKTGSVNDYIKAVRDQIAVEKEAAMSRQSGTYQTNSGKKPQFLEYKKGQTTGASQEEIQFVNRINGALNRGEKVNTKEIERAEKILSKLSGETDSATSKINDMKQAFKNLKGGDKNLDDYKKKLETLRQEGERLANTKLDAKTLTSGFISASGAAFSLSSGLTMINNSLKDISENGPSLTNILSLIGSLGMGMSAVKNFSSAVGELNKPLRDRAKGKGILKEVNNAEKGLGKNAETTSLEKNTIALEQNTAAEQKNKLATDSNTVSSGEAVIADNAESTANVKTAVAEEIDTKAKEKNTKATLANKIAQMGWAGVVIAAVAAVTAAFVIYYKNFSLAAKKTKEYQKATEDLKEAQENASKIQEEIDSLNDLSKKLEEAKDDKKALLEVSKDLNKVIGEVPGLVRGEADAYIEAQARLKAYQSSREAALKIQKDAQIEAGRSAYESAVFEESWETDIAEDDQIKAVMKRVAGMDESQLEKFREKGEINVYDSSFVGGSEDITYKEYQQYLKKLTDAQNAAFQGYYDNAKTLGGLEVWGNAMAATYADIDDTKKLFETLEGESFLNIVNNYLEDAENEQARQAFEDRIEELKREYADFPGLDKIINDYKGLVESSAVTSDQRNTLLTDSLNRVAGSTTDLQKVLKSTSAILKDLSETGKITWSSISTFVDALKEHGVDETARDRVTALLSDPNNIVQNTSEAIGISIEGLLSSEDIENLLVSGNWDEASNVLNLILKDLNLGNSEQITQFYIDRAKALAEIKESELTIVELLANNASELDKIANKYGIITSHLNSGILTKIFEQDLNKQDYNLKEYLYYLKNGGLLDTNNVSDEAAKALEALYLKLDEGTITSEDQPHIESLLQHFISKNAETSEIYSDFFVQNEQARKEASKKYKEDMEKWIKDNSLEKVKDKILQFQHEISVINRDIESLDWNLEISGEQDSVQGYLEKAQLLAEKSGIITEQFNELAAMTPKSDEEASEIASEMESLYKEWMTVKLEISKAEDELSTKSANKLKDLIQTQYELISETLRAMKTLLEINSQQETIYSDQKRRGALLEMIGMQLSAVTEEEKANAKRLKNKKKLDKDIIAQEQWMQDEVNKAALKALKDGIDERQKEREKERVQIQETYDKAMYHIQLSLKDLIDVSKTEFNDMISYMDKVLDDFKSDQLNFQNGMGSQSGSTTVTKGTSKKGSEEYHYKTKSGTAEEIHASGLLAGGTVSAVNHDKHYMDIKASDGTTYRISGVDNIDTSIQEGTKINGANMRLGTAADWTITKKPGEKSSFTDSEKDMLKIDRRAISTSNLKKSVVLAPFDGYGAKAKQKQDVKETQYFQWYTVKFKAPTKGRVEAIDDEYYFISDNGSADFAFTSKYATVQTGICDIGDTIVTGDGGDANPSFRISFYEWNANQDYGDYGDAYTDDVSIDLDSLYSTKKELLSKGYQFDQYYQGSDYTLAGEAFVGEKGRELILLPDGKIVLAGQDGIELANLPEGARVITNEETEEILNNKKDYAGQLDPSVHTYHAYANGTKTPTVDTNIEDISKDFYKEELKKQKEYEKQSEKSNVQHFNTIKKDTQTSTTEVKNAVESTRINLPGVNTDKFFESIEEVAMYFYGGGEWLKPAVGNVTSQYGYRNHPVTGVRDFHEGIDIGGVFGAPVIASKSGKIIVSDYNSANGNYIKIDHGNGYQSLYLHLQESLVEKGDEVKQGQQIGTLGSTGLSTGPHLDFRVYKNGKPINPTELLSHAVGGVTKSGKALVGEYGQEIILYPDGTAGLLGVNGIEYADLPAGAQIIPAEETAKILNNPVNHRVAAYAEGTEYSKEDIALIQQYLISKGYDLGSYGADGIRGTLTNQALEDMLSKTDGFVNIEELLTMILNEMKTVSETVESSSDEVVETFSTPKYLQDLMDLSDKYGGSNSIDMLEILQMAKDYKNYTSDDIKGQAEKAYAKSLELEEAMTQQLPKIIESYIASGEYNPAFLEQLGTVFTELGKAVTKAAEDMEAATKALADAVKTQGEFLTLREQAFGKQTGYLEVQNSLDILNHHLLNNKDIISVYQSLIDYEKSATEYANLYLEEFNKHYEKLIEREEKRVTYLEAQKQLQTSINAETNSYLDIQHDINKELSSSKLKTEWLDKKTKEMLFNEKDYLAITQKLNEVNQAAAEDYQKTKAQINALGEDELYKAQFINEAYEERKKIREQELELLREEIDLTKKQTALNTALLERNVRVFSGGRWRQIANIENVTQAQAELQDTIYQIESKQRELNQQKDLDTNYNQPLRESQEAIADFNNRMDLAAKKLENSLESLKEKFDGLNSFTLTEFSRTVSDIVDDIQQQRKRTKNLGFSDEYESSKEFIEKGITSTEAAMNLIYRYKAQWGMSQSSEDKAFLNEEANKMRSALIKNGMSQEEVERLLYDSTAEEVKYYLQAHFGGLSNLTGDELAEIFNKGMTKGEDIEYSSKVDDITNANIRRQEEEKRRQAYIEILYAKHEAEKLYAQGYSPDTNETLRKYIDIATGHREGILSGESDERTGRNMSASEYAKYLYEEGIITDDDLKAGILNQKFVAESYDGEFDPEKHAEVSVIQEFVDVLRELLPSKENDGAGLSAEEYAKVLGVNEQTLTQMKENVQQALSGTQSTMIQSVETLLSTATDIIKDITKEIEAKRRQSSLIIPQTNAAGTRDSKPGLSLVNEKGVELLTTDYGQIIELNPHQKIFNNDQLNFLYDLSREGLSGMNRAVNAISNNMQDNSLSIQHLEIKLDNVTDARTFAEELQGLTAYIRNTKTIQGRSSR